MNERIPRPKIGVLPVGHKIYWSQFPELKEMGARMYRRFIEKFESIGDVFEAELSDTEEGAKTAGVFFRSLDLDVLYIFPLGYTAGMHVIPALEYVNAPIRILNVHEDSSYDYKNSDTAFYLHHEAVCCVPEYAAGLVRMGRKFKVRSGHLASPRLWREIEAESQGAAASSFFRNMNVGVIGNTYTNMVDMPIDEPLMLKTMGKLVVRPEVEEILEAYERVTENQMDSMYDELREIYDVDASVTNEHLKFSARTAVAYEEIVRKYDIHAFGYYWWGEREIMTQLRCQSTLAVSRLAAMGRPGVTEGDVKTAMACKLMDLLGAGGMFIEFFSMDFDENFILMGHDGPSNINMAASKGRVQHLEVHHGKTGHGLGIDYDMKSGPATLLNITHSMTNDTFKLIYSHCEIVDGDVLSIGNPNCRVRVEKQIHEFIDEWCQEGPSHHCAIGYGHLGAQLEMVGEALDFDIVKV
ncbi:MAG: hypothetical protein KAG97_03860 [Victivallales bacterium]|nr:hypothetical protein [Victivallales bacterium]